MGGLTAVREIMDILPNEDIIYLGGTARVPYGTRSRETIIRYALQDIEFLKRREVKLIIAACGTVSSVMAGERDFSTSPRCIGVISPACEAALRMTVNRRIGVIATPASAKSGSYERLIHMIACRINSAWLMPQAARRSEKSAYSSQVSGLDYPASVLSVVSFSHGMRVSFLHTTTDIFSAFWGIASKISGGKSSSHNTTDNFSAFVHSF